jgi:plastocyanin
LPGQPGGKLEGAPPLVIDQKQETFVPHLVALRAGQKIRFTNSDFANHNVRSASVDDRNVFNVYTGVGREFTREFTADRLGRPIRLGCDIHAWMRGWVYVFDHPYFAVTNMVGEFAIEAIPVGTYQLVIHQPDVGFRESRQVHVLADVDVEIDIRIREADLTLE